jgi:hypothetical protein
MASTSEATIGAKVANAEKISTHLKAFAGYSPSDDALTPAALDTLITNTKTKNTETAASTQDYSSAVDTRQKLFQKNTTSLIKVISPIGATIRSAFGKTSKEATDIAAMITKIRGVKVKKGSKEPNAEFVSQSERSYGSMTQNFSDMITTLEKYGSSYSPANSAIKLDSLKQMLIDVTAANIAVTITYGQLKEKRDDRLDLYKQLTAITQRIKDAVKSQYGLKSTEYNLIKGLKV